MTDLDHVLAKARLATRPYTAEEIEAAERRLAERIASSPDSGDDHRCGPDTGRDGSGPDVSLAAVAGHRRPGSATTTAPSVTASATAASAAANLTDLCEAVLRHHTSLTTLRTFLTSSFPDPSAARVLGCILNLASSEDSAMFWWQYAAGGGDETAGYCLYLHHLALGEHRQAHWWLTTATPETGAETDTALRVLHLLKGELPEEPPLPGPISPLMLYVPFSLSFVDDDLELPLPTADFADRIAALTEAATPRG